MTEREAAMVLALTNGVGPMTAARLRGTFGSYREAARVMAGGAAGQGCVPPRVAAAIRDAVSQRNWVVESELARRAGARFALPGDEDYPEVLLEIADAPVGIFVSGEPLGPLAPMIAVVGSRTPTPRGAAVAAELAADLVRAGLTVASGLARGTDTKAHEGALDAGGRTVAILGCGLACVYPPENAGLARDIVAGGSLVSEFPMLAEPKPGCFPRRNRIISGLSVGVVVVEAAAKSGALITAARALEQGREVFAVPGPVDEPLSAGPNRLIKAGAKLTEDAGDVLDELERAWGPFPVSRSGWLTSGSAHKDAPRQSDANMEAPRQSDADAELPLSRRVLSLLSLKPVTVDDLVAGTGAPVALVLSTLLKLELADEVRSSPGGRFVLGSRARGRAGRG
ncbi:MAG: DNA-processing protein DprA [Candidatus Eisenbacteria bacterium]